MQPEARCSPHRAEKRFALITGATSGLGKELARTCRGYELILSGRSTPQPAAHKVVQADLCNPQDRKKLVQAIRDFTPELVINNAGLGLYGGALSHSTEQQMNILEVNANAVLELTLEAACALKNSGKTGTILNVASAAAFFPFPSFAVYAAAKACVRSFSLALDYELKPYGIRVLVSCPGPVATQFRNRAAKGAAQKSDGYTMSVEKAACAIWRQIEKGQAEMVFDWRYRLGVFLARLLPKSLLFKRFSKNLNSRIDR